MTEDEWNRKVEFLMNRRSFDTERAVDRGAALVEAHVRDGHGPKRG